MRLRTETPQIIGIAATDQLVKLYCPVAVAVLRQQPILVQTGDPLEILTGIDNVFQLFLVSFSFHQVLMVLQNKDMLFPSLTCI